MDDSSLSDIEGSFPLPTLSSILGVKGPLRVRQHGSTQKAHIVLRRVELSDDSEDEEDSRAVVHFSLFAQKRIEVKPGKEILLAIASPGGRVKELPVIFEGDLPTSEESSEEGDAVGVIEQRVFDFQLAGQVVPPKMRRVWTKQLNEVSPIAAVPKPSVPAVEYRSVGIQTDPPFSASPVPAERAQESESAQPQTAHPRASSPTPPPISALQPPLTQQAPYTGKLKNQSEDIISEGKTPQHGVHPVRDVPPDSDYIRPNRERSFSPMELDSPDLSPTTVPPTDSSVNISSASSRASSIASSSDGKLPKPSHRRHDGAKPVLAPLPAQQGLFEVVNGNKVSPAFHPKLSRPPMAVLSTTESSLALEAHQTTTGQSPPQGSAITGPKTPGTGDSSRKHSTGETPTSSQTRRYSSVSSASTALTSGDTARQESFTSISSARDPPSPGIPSKIQSSHRLTSHPRQHTNSTAHCPTQPSSFVASMNQPSAPSRPKVHDQEHVVPLQPKVFPPSTQAHTKEFRGISQPPPSPRSSTRSTAPVPGLAGNSVGSTYSFRGAVLDPLSSSMRPSYTDLLRTLIHGPAPLDASGHSTARSPPAIPPTTSQRIWDSKPLFPSSHLSTPTSSGDPNSADRASPTQSQSRSSASTLNQLPPRGNVTGTARRNSNATETISDQSTKPDMSFMIPASAQGVLGQAVKSEPPDPRTRTSFGPDRVPPPLPTSAPSPINGPSVLSSRGIKRAPSLDADDADLLRPRKRLFKWPTLDCVRSVRLIGNGDVGIRGIAFNSDGCLFAVVCVDRTIRIMNNHDSTELARLTHNSAVVSVAWMDDDAGIILLTEDGMISKWIRTGQNQWQWAKILDARGGSRIDDDLMCFAYAHDRIAVAFPRVGVKVWMWIKGIWQLQRPILRQNVSSLKFVEDGEALLGGTRDGVLWYCQIPNGTLRAYTFLKSKVYCIDVNPSEQHALVAQIGGRAHLVGITQDDHKGKIEQVYSSKDTESQIGNFEFGAVFTGKGKAVLFGTVEGCVLVWDKCKGDIIYGLEHGEDDVVQAVASFDGPSTSNNGYLITGTKNGRLTWWSQPPLEGKAP